MTSLTDYLIARNETQTAFAGRSGLTDATLSRILSGKGTPSAVVVEKIRLATRGAVTPNDVFETWRQAQKSAGSK